MDRFWTEHGRNLSKKATFVLVGLSLDGDILRSEDRAYSWARSQICVMIQNFENETHSQLCDFENYSQCVSLQKTAPGTSRDKEKPVITGDLSLTGCNEKRIITLHGLPMQSRRVRYAGFRTGL